MTSTGSSRLFGTLNLVVLAFALSSVACEPNVRSGVTETASDPALGKVLVHANCIVNKSNGQGQTAKPNGICQNGLAAQGLDEASGLATSSFATWFNSDPTLSDVVMQYVYRCAAPPERSISWTNPATGASYTWAGGLGLAPGWTGGASATVAEQQIVSACLGAMVNKYGVHVTILLEGQTATGTSIGTEPWELATFPVKEACFFGNVFANEGIFVGLDHPAWDPKTSSSRACALDQKSVGPSTECPPMYFVESCARNCQLDSTGTYYRSCTYNGVTYKPLTTRIQPSDVYTCGDGVCEFTEHCGSGTTADSCEADCGLCP
jgi:hypothetical protein